MGKFLVITLATGKYKKYLRELFKSLENITVPFDLCIISDGDTGKLYEDVRDEIKGNVYDWKIQHLPWPIITCCKFLYVKEIIDRLNPNYVLYLDAVMRLRKEFKFEDFMLDKVNVWEHFLWDFMSDSERRFLHNERKNTYSYIKEEDRYEYVHAGMFFGRTDMIKSLCIEVQELMNKELRNGILPQWHDESCLNYVYHQLSDNFNVISSQVYDEGAPNRYSRPIEDYQLSFENCTDCQEIKKV